MYVHYQSKDDVFGLISDLSLADQGVLLRIYVTQKRRDALKAIVRGVLDARSLPSGAAASINIRQVEIDALAGLHLDGQSVL